MLTLPDPIIAILAVFAPLFSRPVFAQAQVLLAGAILAPGRRTVASALRVMGLSQTPHFQNYHRVLNRAHWSPHKAARTLMHLLVTTFVPEGPVIIGGDETLERRRGDKIEKKGIYKDSARSSKSFLVKSSGLRWIVFMLLVPVPWAGRHWALPFFAVLAPSERYHQQHKKRHKTLALWAGQMLKQVRRWLPERQIVFVADGSYSVLELLMSALKQQITVVTRLRLDAGLYAPAPPKKPKGSGPTGRSAGQRQTPAHALATRRRPGYALDPRASSTLVQPQATRSRDCLGVLCLVQSRPRRAHPLCVGARSARQVQDTGACVY